MSEKIVVGPVNQGLRTDRTAFVIDNDSFPLLVNAYQWRGRIKRKRGTSLLGRLIRYFDSTSSSYTGTTVNPSYTITFDGSGNANLFGPYTNATPLSFSLQVDGNIIPGSVSITGSVGPVTYTDPTQDGYLTPTGTGGSNTINYATGAIHIPAQAGGTATAHFQYYPDLPVEGLEDLNLTATSFPGTIAFDTVYSYNISTTSPYSIWDVSFYKNPPSGGSYTHKTNVTPVTWNGETYQQFWTVNYQGALWATNGIKVPFSITNIGMQYLTASQITSATQTSATTVDFVIPVTPLVIGDFVFANEFTGASADTLNLQTGFVTAIAGTTYTVTFPNATIGAAGLVPGILQYLTNRSDVTKDGIRWYDGDPTNGANAVPPVLTGQKGWVNFAPPLNQFTLFPNFSIADLPPAQYYLVGARMIVPYKDRLLFIGPVIQTSAANSQVYLQDTVIYSQNGTPYYTASFTGSVTSAATVFHQLLVPTNQTATASAYFEDSAGFGGFITAGYAQPIVTAGFNEDVLILGFSTRQTRFVYTGNDLLPFTFYTINSELGSGSTFSGVTLDRGVITIGNQGIVLTAQVSSQRIDLQIPDSVFQFNLTNNGPERICAQRDFVSEWIYFTYMANEEPITFPNQTLQYNYRDESWAVFNECYTTYGTFRKLTGYTWATIGSIFATWGVWNDPWDSGTATLLQQQVIAGNQQGFVVFRDDGTNESNSLYIRSISGQTVTSPAHSLNNGDYIIISGCLGTIDSSINGKIFKVQTALTDTFVLNGDTVSGTYVGGGVIKRMYIPQIQTKQFPIAWGLARKTRIGVQQYLLSKTNNGQITLNIFLSQDNANPYNAGNIVPQGNVENSSLVYSTILYTCPESTNLGLTPANVNLQMPTAAAQKQIWHRMNTSLIGDTVQVGFTMNDTQMRDTTFSNQFSEIELHAMILSVSPSQVLA